MIDKTDPLIDNIFPVRAAPESLSRHNQSAVMRMKPVFFLPLFLLFFACEEVIQLDLDSAGPRLVAEANLDATQGACTLKLTRSGDFYQNNTFEAVTGAQAVLRLAGVEYAFTEEGSGEYRLTGLAPSPGDTAVLRFVLADGQAVESKPALVPSPVPLDTLLIAPNAAAGGPGGGAEQYLLTAEWQDEAGKENYYRLKIDRNDELLSELYLLADDRLGDGARISRPVIRQSFGRGDVLRVKLLSVNRDYYDYFTDLANAGGRGLAAPAPYNPKSNWTAETLGYFGIWQQSESLVKVE